MAEDCKGAITVVIVQLYGIFILNNKGLKRQDFSINDIFPLETLQHGKCQIVSAASVTENIELWIYDNLILPN